MHVHLNIVGKFIGGIERLPQCLKSVAVIREGIVFIKRSKKDNEEAPATTRPRLIEWLLTKFAVGGEKEEEIHTVMADTHMKQN